MTEAIEIAPGVLLHRSLNSNDYCGTVQALVAEGYVREDQLPGFGTNGKSMVSFAADGSRVSRGSSTASRQAGYFKVRPAGRGLLRVEVRISANESFARHSMHLAQCRRTATELARRAKSWPFPICGAQLLGSLP